MSNRRKTRPAKDGSPASLRREPDGTLTVMWPKGRPDRTVITTSAIEALVAAHNEAVRAAPKTPAPRPSLLTRLGAWWSAGDDNTGTDAEEGWLAR